MAFNLTPDNLRGIYDMLRCCAPFRGWHLQRGEEVSFHVTKHQGFYGQHIADRAKPNQPHIIQVSAYKNVTLHGAIATVAHEMIHVYEHKLGIRANHGPSFNRRADAVCKKLHLDRGTF